MWHQVSKNSSTRSKSNSLWKRIDKLPPKKTSTCNAVQQHYALPLDDFLGKVYKSDPLSLQKKTSSQTVIEISCFQGRECESPVLKQFTENKNNFHSQLPNSNQIGQRARAKNLQTKIESLSRQMRHYFSEQKVERLCLAQKNQVLNKKVHELSDVVQKLMEKNKALEDKVETCQKQIAELKGRERTPSTEDNIEPDECYSQKKGKITSPTSASTKRRFSRHPHSIQKLYQTKTPKNSKKTFFNFHASYNQLI